MAVGRIQTYDLVVRNPFQVLDDAAQAVAVCDDQKLILKFQTRENRLFPIGKDPFDRIFQRFGTGQFAVGNLCITAVEFRIPGIGLRKRIGGYVVTSSPDRPALLPYCAAFSFCSSL